jgi:hypothetical protein
MKRFKALTLVVVALICAVAVSVALGAVGGGAQKKPHAKLIAKVQQKAAPVAKVAPAKKAAIREVAAKSSGDPTDGPADAGAADTSSAGDAADTASAPEAADTSDAETSSAAETDGVDAGGDHQCPPDCAKGEQP